MKSVDWEQLAIRLGCLTETGEHGSSELARQAQEIIVGKNVVKDTVDCCVFDRPGKLLAQAFLEYFGDVLASKRCYEIYQTMIDEELKAKSIALLCKIANPIALEWVGEFLQSEIESVRYDGLKIVLELLERSFIDDEDADPILEQARNIPNVEIQALVRQIEEKLEDYIEDEQ